MDIDMTIVVAQIVNFILLVWLLRRFLYKPITDAIAAREKAVKDTIENAERLQREAKEQIARYENMQAELTNQRENYLKEAREEAEREKGKMMERVAEEGEALRRRFAALLDEEREKLRQSFQEGLIKQVCRVSDTLIREVAGRTLEDGLLDGFDRALEREEVDPLPTDIALPVTVRISFQPDEQQVDRLRHLIERAVGRQLKPSEVRIEFDPGLILGLEIDGEHTTMTWSAERHLKLLEDEALALVSKAVNTVKSEVQSHA